MKRFFVFSAFLACSLFLLPQTAMANNLSFHPLRLDAGAGFGVPFSDDGAVGLYYIEAKYEIKDKIVLGLRYEDDASVDINDDAVGMDTASACFITLDYYLNNNLFRPFIGIGAGAYWIFGGDSNEGIGVDLNPGGMLRAGFDICHFRLAVAYNYGGDHLNKTFQFASVNLGFYIGGGKK